jgi:serralysin
MCFLCQSLDPKRIDYDLHGLTDMSATVTTDSATGAALPVYSLDQVAYQLTHGYWQSTNRDWRAFDVDPGDILTVNLDGLDATGQSAAMAALAAWTAVSGLQFQTTAGDADITFGDDDSGAYSYSYIYTGYNEIASSYVNVNPSWQNNEAYYHQTYIHEIGHALGLGHGGNYNGSADFGSQAHYANDSWQMSIMSYFGQWENPNVDASSNYLATTQMADILAIQNLYGTPDNVNTGDTVYGDDTNLTLLGMDLNRDWAVTIFDSSGTDLIDLGSRSYDQRVSLVAETWSDLNGETANFAIARGAEIENATTGSGDDEVVGNDAANMILTGSGADTLIGGAGNDTLDGGDGTDVAIFEGNPDAYDVTFGGGLIVTDTDPSSASGQGADVLIDIESLIFTDGYIGEIDADGTTTTVRFYADGSALTSSLVRLDTSDSYDWTTVTRSFAAGLWDSQINTYDDGRVLEIDYEEGLRTSATMTDLADIFIWTSYTDDYNTEGTRLTNSITYDNGMDVLTRYTDGVRSGTLTTDGADTQVWTTIDRSFDAAGTLTLQVNQFDDGSTQEIAYTDGQRSAITVVDGGDSTTWTNYTDSFDATGARIAREMTYDDGRHVEITYDEGQVTTHVLSDQSDEFAWASVTRVWDEDGMLDGQLNVFDDGRVQEIAFVDGLRSSSAMTDTADAYAWQSSYETYDDTGSLVERVTIWDNGLEDVFVF